MPIVVDAMGAERGIYISVRGGLEALRTINEDVLFIGDSKKISAIIDRHCLAKHKHRVDIHHAEDVILMTDKPKDALRKRQSSLALAMKQVKTDPSYAFISAGNTGAILAHAMFTLGKLPMIERPCITSAIPTSHDKAFLSDAGANTNCRPIHLYQFALMSRLYAKHIYGVKNPSVAVISNGSESMKGNDLTRGAYKMMESSEGLNFKGYVEGKGVLRGEVDVAVCDGFVGNIILKTIEGVAEAMGLMTKQAIRSSLLYSAGGILARGAFKKLKNRVDYSEFGGAPFLGVKGGVFVCHGNSNVNALKNGIIKAAAYLQQGLNEKIQESVELKSNDLTFV